MINGPGLWMGIMLIALIPLMLFVFREYDKEEMWKLDYFEKREKAENAAFFWYAVFGLISMMAILIISTN